MKRFSLSLVLIFSLQAAPMPAYAGNGMTDIISTMMQLFLWMMSGGSGMSGLNSYGMNPYGMNPYSFGGMGGQGFPFQGSSFPGYSGRWGGSPYSQYGYGARSPYYGSYNNSYGYPYNSRYSYRRYGYADPYYPSYNQYGADYPKQGKTSPVIIQPIIVSLGQNSDGTKAPKVEILPAQSVDPVKRVPSAGAGPNAAVPPPPVNAYDPWDYDNPLPGRWQGVNGEFLELGRYRFYLRSQYSEMQGTYQVKNGIMKAEIINHDEPVYMQYRMADGQLVFRSADGQMMLFRRLD
ncbi:hypothetical protein BMS3Bbin11_00686 [bacterium BMS3Bbin11]|nr:hypothetical protein BMS3Abin11_01225 [bacterium BMS3Abin11]GBE45597.1 hypothetical protein BMS3Bbin11_00686 [bacterium BMS3Bbin11]HDH08672.1 hypothetical protein [Gammaproteobacteria bacterium]HDH15164.1 hypothetical protein [Gammaproteobacteria bacterium]